DEGIRLLKLLANHPATMHHVSRKLCQRFVNDDPPDGCVDDAVAAWQRSSGDMREVLRAIFHGPDFWAAANVRAKVKTPLEFVVSAARAVAADQLIGVVNEKILSGTMSENTKQVLRRDLAGIGDPAQARALAVGLAIGGPEFQKQ